MTDSRTPTALIVGASRGLGHAMAAEFLGRGWDVVGTVRDPTTRTPLHDLADRSSGRLEVEHLDINQPAQLAPLHDRLAARQTDRLAARQLDRLAAGQTDRIRTGLGGPEAPFTMEETVPRVVDVLLSRRGKPGLAYLARFGKTVPW